MEFNVRVGVTKGYAPEQPIAYSHKLHSGINGIDCNYCHHSARHGKSVAIPSANVCMNCHTYINEGPQEKQRFKRFTMQLVLILKKDNISMDMSKNLLSGLGFITYQIMLILIIHNTLLRGIRVSRLSWCY